jgi:hypothetical protein
MLLLNPFTTSFYYGRNSTINSNYLQFLLLLRNQLIKNSDRNRNWLFGAAMNEPTQLVDLRLLRPLRPPSPLEWPSLLGYPGGRGVVRPRGFTGSVFGICNFVVRTRVLVYKAKSRYRYPIYDPVILLWCHTGSTI